MFSIVIGNLYILFFRVFFRICVLNGIIFILYMGNMKFIEVIVLFIL